MAPAGHRLGRLGPYDGDAQCVGKLLGRRLIAESREEAVDGGRAGEKKVLERGDAGDGRIDRFPGDGIVESNQGDLQDFGAALLQQAAEPAPLLLRPGDQDSPARERCARSFHHRIAGGEDPNSSAAPAASSFRPNSMPASTGRSAVPRIDSLRIRLPSTAASTPSSSSEPPEIRARAPTGIWQPPPRALRKARSARTAAEVEGSSRLSWRILPS